MCELLTIRESSKTHQCITPNQNNSECKTVIANLVWYQMNRDCKHRTLWWKLLNSFQTKLHFKHVLSTAYRGLLSRKNYWAALLTSRYTAFGSHKGETSKHPLYFSVLMHRWMRFSQIVYFLNEEKQNIK